MSQNDKQSSKDLPWKEILAFLGTVLVAYLGYLGIRSQIEIPIQYTQTAQVNRFAISTPLQFTPSATMSPLTNQLSFTVTSLAIGTQTPTSTLKSQPSIASTLLATLPTTQSTAIKPITAPGIGLLDVHVSLEGCEKLGYSITIDNQTTGNGIANQKTQVAAGIYTIVLQSHFGNKPIKEGVAITQGATTVVDFTKDLGKLRVNGYPQINAPLYVITPPNSFPIWLLPGSDQCGPIGTHQVNFHIGSSGSGVFGSFGGITYTTLIPDDFEWPFEVEIKAGATTILDPDDWPYQLGRLTFLPAKTIGEAQIETLQDHILFSRSLNNGGGAYWMLAGRYKITLLSQPYTGTAYEFEIKPGEDTTLQLPP